MKQPVALFDTLFGPGRFRLILVGAFFLSGFLLIGSRLYLEQVQTGSEYRETISRQSVRRIRIPSRRGKIFTRDMVLLAGGARELNLIFYPEEMRSRRRAQTVRTILAAAETIAAAIGRENPLEQKEVERHLNIRPGLPITVFRNLTVEEAARALESARPYSGVDLEDDEVRTYPEGELAAHLIGYTRPQARETAEDHDRYFYYLPDQTGRSGIERAFDRLPDVQPVNGLLGTPDAPLGLRGLPGYSLVLVDHLGFIRQSLIEKIEPVHGNNLVLTLDSRAQKLARQVLGRNRGAFVLLDAANGDLLAAASAPGIDLRDFSPVLTSAHYKKLLDDPNRPLINRALQGTYPPGSILKPLVALAFLNSGIPPETIVDCTGAVTIGDVTIRCAARHGHGPLDMVHAIARSCNPYMIENALKTGLTPITEILSAAGLGRATGIELPEASGIFPSDAYKRRHYRDRWKAYDTGLLSMGQGIITITPLQAALYAAAIANGGTIYRPHLVEKVVDPFGNVLQERRPETNSQLPVTLDMLETVREGMLEVVSAPYGSGREGAVPGLKIYGKTGSAEFGPRSDRRLITWFICFLTHGERTYAASVMVEEGVSGGRSCAPLAAEFFSRYFDTFKTN